MKIKIDGSSMVLDLFSLLEAMPVDERMKLADTLACTDAVITFVAQQIIDGWTEQGSHGSKGSVQAEPHPGGLDWAIREVSMHSGLIAAKEILRLQEALAAKEKQLAELEALQGHAFRQRIGNFSE